MNLNQFTDKLIDKASYTVKEVCQKHILKYKSFVAEEKARIKTVTLTKNLYKKTSQALHNEQTKTKLDKLRYKTETRLLQVQLDTISNISEVYQKSIKDLEDDKLDLSSKEKEKLLNELKETFHNVLSKL